jgi:hypothetical protein
MSYRGKRSLGWLFAFGFIALILFGGDVPDDSETAVYETLPSVEIEVPTAVPDVVSDVVALAESIPEIVVPTADYETSTARASFINIDKATLLLLGGCLVFMLMVGNAVVAIRG